jgi:hypothetical protein
MYYIQICGKYIMRVGNKSEWYDTFCEERKELNFEFYYLIFQCIKRAKKGK